MTSPKPKYSKLRWTVRASWRMTFLPKHCAHFTTRTNVQFNWIPLSKARM